MIRKLMVVCVGVFLASGCSGSSALRIDDGATDVAVDIAVETEMDAVAVAAAFAAETDDDRPELLATMGVPDTFAISWEEVEGNLVQMESWGYHGYATRVDLVDREIVLTTDLDLLDPDTLYPGWYDPMAFTALMSMSDAVALAAATSPATFQPEAVDLSGSDDDFAQMDLYAGDQIILGFFDEQLVYVESVALAPREIS